MLAALFDQTEGGGVPEGGGAAVAQDHLVAVGEGEQLLHGVAQPAHHELDRGLAVAGPEVVGGLGGQGSHRFGAHLGGPATEPAIRGEQVGGNGDGGDGGHGASVAANPFGRRAEFRLVDG